MVNFAEDPDPGKVGKLQVIMVTFSLWVSLTLVLALIAFWYIRKHEPILSYVVGSTPILGASVSIWFWMQYEPERWRKIVSGWRVIYGISVFAVVAFEVVLFMFLIPWAKEGGRYDWIRDLICVDLSYQKLVTEPEKERDYEGLYWGSLNMAHLEGARLVSSVLKRANLKSVQLQHAKMSRSDLVKADLQKANMQNADLRHANLEAANLEEAILQKANLEGVKLRKASFDRANPQEANLRRADLQGANLKNTDLAKAILWVTTPTSASFRSCKEDWRPHSSKLSYSLVTDPTWRA